MSVVETIRKQILKDTQFLIIPANTTKKIPDLPYGVINVTSPFIKDRGQGIEMVEEVDSKLYLKRKETHKETLSLTIFAENEEAAREYAKTIHKWFIFFGRTFLQDQGIVVIGVGNIEARTTFLLESYEYKQGFDVQIRLSEEYQQEIEPMDSIGGI